MPNLVKTNDTIPRRCLDRWKYGPKDGQTVFYRTLPATSGGPKNTFHQENQITYESTQSNILCCKTIPQRMQNNS